MESAVQRKNMVDSQVRPSDVTDRRIARAMLEIPREAFAPASRRAVAYMDANLPVTEDQGPAQRVLLAPRTLAKMIQALDLGDGAAVLDLAPASGYSTAVLARIARRVIAVEPDPALARWGQSVLSAQKVANAEMICGPVSEGHVAESPYDAILLGGKVAEMPAGLIDQLKDGGRLVAIVDVGGVSRAFEWRRFGMNADRRPLFDAEAPMLPGFARVPGFVL